MVNSYFGPHPFWEFHWEEAGGPEVVACALMLFFSGVLCSAAGIGGGGVYVTLLMVVGGLTPHNAVPLSKAIVFFGSIASLMVNMMRSLRPVGGKQGRQVIDYDACRLMIPAALLGTFLGCGLNVQAKGFTIVLVLTCLLVFMTAMVIREAWTQHSQEVEGSGGGGHRPQVGHDPDVPTESTPLARAAPWSESRGKLSSLDVSFAVAMMTAIVFGCALQHHVAACGPERSRMCLQPAGQRAVMHVPIVLCSGVAVYYGLAVHRAGGWRVQAITGYQAAAGMTGLLAGLVGVGGGLVLCPFFILTGMEPSVAVATSSTCVLFTSSSTTAQYLFTDRIHAAFAILYGSVTLLASFVGTSLVHSLQDRFGTKRSYITAIVACGVALSTVLSVAKLVRLMLEDSTSAVSGAVM